MDYAIDNVITIGPKNYPLYRFDNSSIVLNSINGVFSVDTIGNELTVDTFAFTVRYDPSAPQIYAPVGDDGYELLDGPVYELVTAQGRDYMMELAYGTPVYWFCGGDFFTKAYLKQVERLSRYAWRLTCISGVGLLNDSYHSGGLYAGATVEEIAAEIIGDVFPYAVSPTAGTVTVNGWLPYDTRRANLHRLLFATGAALLRGDVDTDYTVGFLTESEEPPVIGPERVAVNGKTSYLLPATAVEVTEHAFFESATDEAEILYDNTETQLVSGLLVVFGGPHYALATTGTLTIEDSGVNYAVVSGVGTLVGKPYSHTTSIIKDGGNDRLVKKVTADNCLISALNSQNVAKRALTYFQSARTIEAKVMLQSERCGLIYNITDAFGDSATAFLKQMTVTPTSVIAAACQFIAGYTPTGQGNFYNNRVFISASGTWTVPAGVNRLRVILIGGGAGGAGGWDGEAGQTPNASDGRWTGPGDYDGYQVRGYTGQAQSKGGTGGLPGEQGKIFTSDVTVEPGAVLTFVIGSGGAGGAANGGTGLPGTPTSISSLALTASSDDGNIVAAYADPMTQDLFAYMGAEGIAGGDGGMTDTVDLQAYNGGDGLSGGNAGENTGGAGGEGKVHAKVTLPPGFPDLYYDGSGGGGGGAAYGAAGSAGSVASDYYIGDPPTPFIQFADGGDGADADAPDSVTYGCGGNGGHGGGAGGNGAGGVFWTLYGATVNSTGGTGGTGSAGGAGGAGCAIIYY